MERPETFGAFFSDLTVSRFARGPWRWLGLGLGVAAGAAFAFLPSLTAIALVVLVGGALATAVVVLEHERWHAQDVAAWYVAARTRSWIRDTGGPSPSSGAAEAEVWLGAHARGSVPQLYRVLAAARTDDEHAFDRELAAMPDADPVDRARTLWAQAAHAFDRNGSGDLEPLRAALPTIPPGEDHAQIETWLAQIEASERHGRGDATWLEPILAERPRTERVPIRPRAWLGIWMGRLVVVVVFVITAVTTGALASELGSANQAAIDFPSTRLATRGDIPAYDDQAVSNALPALAGAMAGAQQVGDGPLDEAATSDAIDNGLPTLIWETRGVDLHAAPPGQQGRPIWAIEVLLGGPADTADALVTFDREDGPTYRYAIDPAAVAALRQAVGIGAAP